MWIHKRKNWPNFTWNAETLSSKLIKVRHDQGHLLGRMENLGFDLKLAASLNILISDVVKSSAIEGKKLDSQEVRSSVARRLGLDVAKPVPASRDVEGIVEMMLDATQKFSQPLTKKRLFDWHSSLFPTGRSGMHQIAVGRWRAKENDPMQVVSGPVGREKVHFEAPAADRLEKEMQTFLKWFRGKQNLDPFLKAGIAHLWFVTIHPFEDGNGRMARSICDMALAQADKTSERFYSLSSQIKSERKDYFRQLEKQQRSSVNITDWLSWFLNCLERAISNAETIIGHVLFKDRLWKMINQNPVNERQRFVINRMLEDDFEGHMRTSKYAKMAKCSNDTALRDIQDLKERGVLIQNAGRGRSTSYKLPEPEDV